MAKSKSWCATKHSHCVTHGMLAWVSIEQGDLRPPFSTVLWHSCVYATRNNKTYIIQLKEMPLEAHLGKKTLFGRLAKSWLSKSRLVQQQKKLTPPSELPGLSLSTKAISSNTELPLSRSPRCFTHKAGLSRSSQSGNHGNNGGRVEPGHLSGTRALSHGHNS